MCDVFAPDALSTSTLKLQRKYDVQVLSGTRSSQLDDARRYGGGGGGRGSGVSSGSDSI